MLIFCILGVYSLPALAVRNGYLVTSGETPARFTARLDIYDARGEMLKRCTGVLVDQQALLASAHCFPAAASLVIVTFGANALDPLSYAVTTTHFEIHPDFKDIPTDSPNILADQKTSGEFGAPALEVTPGYYEQQFKLLDSLGDANFLIENYGEPEVPYHDLAVILLDDKVPERLKPIKLARNFSITFGTEIYGFGFGRYSIAANAVDDQLRQTQTIVTSVIADGTSVSHFSTFAMNDSNVCTGDSGGPGLIQQNGSFELAGILSAQNNSCYGYNHYAVPHYDLKWLSEMAQKYLGREFQY